MLKPRKKVSAKMAKLIADRRTDELLPVFEAIEKAASEGKYDLLVKFKIGEEGKSRLMKLGYKFMYNGLDVEKKENPHKITWHEIDEE